MKELKEKLEILEDTRQQWKVRHYLVSIVTQWNTTSRHYKKSTSNNRQGTLTLNIL